MTEPPPRRSIEEKQWATTLYLSGVILMLATILVLTLAKRYL